MGLHIAIMFGTWMIGSMFAMAIPTLGLLVALGMLGLCGAYLLKPAIRERLDDLWHGLSRNGRWPTLSFIGVFTLMLMAGWGVLTGEISDQPPRAANAASTPAPTDPRESAQYFRALDQPLNFTFTDLKDAAPFFDREPSLTLPDSPVGHLRAWFASESLEPTNEDASLIAIAIGEGETLTGMMVLIPDKRSLAAMTAASRVAGLAMNEEITDIGQWLIPGIAAGDEALHRTADDMAVGIYQPSRQLTAVVIGHRDQLTSSKDTPVQNAIDTLHGAAANQAKEAAAERRVDAARQRFLDIAEEMGVPDLPLAYRAIEMVEEEGIGWMIVDDMMGQAGWDTQRAYHRYRQTLRDFRAAQ
ncbi:hypothetical protein ACERK3_13760 [Phycisphaerales bacterium AB-hyl4]|uniref:Uncharacterized protein n=1 Tax=Natronomicrosphaera hydrolytica TaxID=3242702 RepID=A0ABV4U9F5_9BACT